MKVQSYVEERKASDPEFSQDYESGYADFKIGAMLRAARRGKRRA